MNIIYTMVYQSKQSWVITSNKNAEKRWKNFLTDNSDLIESAQPKPLKIYINSNGGDVFAAIPLIDAITNCTIPIHTYIEGIAASSASLI